MYACPQESARSQSLPPRHRSAAYCRCSGELGTFVYWCFGSCDPRTGLPHLRYARASLVGGQTVPGQIPAGFAHKIISQLSIAIGDFYQVFFLYFLLLMLTLFSVNAILY